jgi:predicted metal-dependent phosphoesterase TrpH
MVIYTPTQLCQQALQAGIKIIGFTDHDSLNGIEEGLQAAAKLGIKLIPGVELGSQQEGGSVHILGYGVRRDYEPLLEKMQWLRHAREARLEKILAKLKEHDIEVEVTECDPLNRAVGRPHVAKAMVAKGYVQGVQEAFDKYLGAWHNLVMCRNPSLLLWRRWNLFMLLEDWLFWRILKRYTIELL